jgi:ribonuclease HII
LKFQNFKISNKKYGNKIETSSRKLFSLHKNNQYIYNMSDTEVAKKTRTKSQPLPPFHNVDKYEYEIGIDEAGRGPLFGRVYVAGVVLPKDGSMDISHIRDSKKLSKKKLSELYDYICKHSLVYHIAFIEAEEIDTINIREAVVKGMHECARECIHQLSTLPVNDTTTTKERYFLCVDGNDFPPYYHNGQRISWETFISGDNTYASIAAASILAKVARDRYILDICKRFPKLSEIYGMDNHMGYGTKKHLDAIREHGITEYHRKTFGTCKDKPFYSIL